MRSTLRQHLMIIETPQNVHKISLGPVYTKPQRQRCDNSDDAPEWVCNPFSSVSIDFNKSKIARVIAEWS